MPDTPHALTPPITPEAITVPLVPAREVEAGARITPVHIVNATDHERLKAGLEARDLNYLEDQAFSPEGGNIVKLPGADGRTAMVIMGVDSDDDEKEMRAGLLGRRLSEGYYRLESVPRGWSLERTAIGWALGAYQFSPFLREARTAPTLLLSDDMAVEETRLVAQSVMFGRQLIDMPAGDMGPEALEAAARALAKTYDAEVQSIVGRELLDKNYPMIHAVGRAAGQAPRLVQIEWGNPDHPRLAVVGKGITFDTGGVNMKGASGARLMKKDMGGAAHALALSMMIMGANLPVRLHTLIPIAENAVSADAYRPGDILRSRAGLTVEIDNTDAEGRLVLGDALARAVESDPKLIIDFATLTGAARVALGPTLAPFYSNREGPVDNLLDTAFEHADPFWRMPLWQSYNRMLSSPIADMKNAGGRFAGSVTAALFLERFVDNRPWMHFDVYGWNPSARPASPAGAEIYAVRGLFAWLKGGGLNSDFD